eukprot:2237104-Rhodomonas_salina.1
MKACEFTDLSSASGIAQRVSPTIRRDATSFNALYSSAPSPATICRSKESAGLQSKEPAKNVKVDDIAEMERCQWSR